jgi:glycosyltransferase involved in cell wall biosynthesis
MQFASTPLYRAGKFIYYGIFNAIAGAALCRPARKSIYAACKRPSIKIVSYYGWQNGIAQGAILQHAALETLGYDVEIVDVTRAMKNPFARVACKGADVFVIHCTVKQFLRCAWPLRNVLSRGRVIAYFAWELPDPPPDWPRSPRLWDEIWTPSHFSATALAKCYDCPVRIVPHVLLTDRSARPRSWRRGNEPLRFLTVADARSSLSRKNPIGAVEAFQMAFRDERDVQLMVKLHMTDIRDSPEIGRLLSKIRSDPRIRLLNQTMERDQILRLFLDSHVLVSLHRAEGFGLPLLEAQTIGLATIATAWSGSLDFTNNETSLLVPYALTTTRDERRVYEFPVTWAEPDIQSAAAAMRRLYDHPEVLSHFAAAGWEAAQPKQQLNRFTAALGDAGLRQH